MTTKRILVPVDFSDDSLRALDYAADFVKPLKAELQLLYVVEPIYYAMPAPIVNGCHVTRESGGERLWAPELRATGDDGSGGEIGVIVLR
jgi:nucleotide-binding universal stress UspA family protein